MVIKPHKSLKQKISDVAHKEGLSDIGFTNPKLDPEEFKNFKDFAPMYSQISELLLFAASNSFLVGVSTP